MNMALRNDLLLPRIRKYRDLHRRIVLPKQVMQNEFRIEVMGEDGRCQWLTDWFHNNITNVGLDMCTTTVNRYKACQVGFGNAAPTDTDTTLQTFAAGTTSRPVALDSNSGAPLYYTQVQYRYDFATGAVVGNVAEVAVGPLATNGASVFSRELIRDSGGAPTTITITAQQALRVHYRVRVYPSLVDVASSCTISGSGDHALTIRSANVNNDAVWDAGDNFRFGRMPSNGGVIAYATGLKSLIASTNTYGTNLGQCTSGTEGSYSPGTFSRGYSVVFGIATGNGNINMALAPFGRPESSPASRCFYSQILYSPVIPKTNLDELTLEFVASWGRYTPP